jgi:hypothetical protein
MGSHLSFSAGGVWDDPIQPGPLQMTKNSHFDNFSTFVAPNFWHCGVKAS